MTSHISDSRTGRGAVRSNRYLERGRRRRSAVSQNQCIWSSGMKPREAGLSLYSTWYCSADDSFVLICAGLCLSVPATQTELAVIPERFIPGSKMGVASTKNKRAGYALGGVRRSGLIWWHHQQLSCFSGSRVRGPGKRGKGVGKFSRATTQGTRQDRKHPAFVVVPLTRSTSHLHLDVLLAPTASATRLHSGYITFFFPPGDRRPMMGRCPPHVPRLCGERVAAR